LKRVNSSTSAPAMKPSFAERMTRPFRIVPANFVQGRLQLLQRFAREGVRRLALLVEGQPGQAVAIGLPMPMLRERRAIPCPFPLQRFDQHRSAEAAADADGRHASLRTRAFERFQQVQDDSCTGGSHRVADAMAPPSTFSRSTFQLAHGARRAELLPAVLVVLPSREAAEPCAAKASLISQ